MALPPASNAAQIVTFIVENAGAGTLQAGVTTLGQVFRQGDLPAGQKLLAKIGAVSVPVQVDVKATYPDGSVKMAVLSFERPSLPAKAALEVSLEKATASAAQPAVNLAAVSAQHTLTVELTPVGGQKIDIDVMSALRDALSKGTATVWQEGPLATQARVEIDLPGSMRLKFDVTAFKGGQISVDAVFANDQAMQAVGGRVAYDVVARLNGTEVIRESVNHGQYQTWHREFESSEANGGQGLGAPGRGWLNIRHDIEYLKGTGAIAQYDLSFQIPEQTLSSYATRMSADDWGSPLAANGVAQQMGAGGGRPDLGYTTGHNVTWLMTGDARAAAYSLGQAEASGSVPWHFWDGGNGTWLNTDHYPRLWTDARGGTGVPGHAQSGGLTQQVDRATGWELSSAHQPDLSFVPYLLTGERWILDNLNAQAAWSVMGRWPNPRQDGEGILVGTGEVRAAAWSIRQVENAAWINPDGSAEKAYFDRIAQNNWNHILAKIPEWTAMQGEAHGWIPGHYGVPGAMPPWQQDYFAGIAIIAAGRGREAAAEVLDWMSNFLVGRFDAADKGFSIRDGVAYNLIVNDPVTGAPLKTWAEISAATISAGLSQTTRPVGEWGSAEYPMLGLATLAGLYHLTGDPKIADLYRSLLAEQPRDVKEANYTGHPTYAVTIPDIYDIFFPPPGTTSPAPAPLPAPTPTPDQPVGGVSPRRRRHIRKRSRSAKGQTASCSRSPSTTSWKVRNTPSR